MQGIEHAVALATALVLQTNHMFGYDLYLQYELVRLTELAGVLAVLLVLLHLPGVWGVQQQLLDVRRLQPVRGHGHEHLTKLPRRQLQVSNKDGWRTGKVKGHAQVQHFLEQYKEIWTIGGAFVSA